MKTQKQARYLPYYDAGNSAFIQIKMNGYIFSHYIQKTKVESYLQHFANWIID